MAQSNRRRTRSRPSTKAAERLAVIVDAAERAALSVIDDAEKEARRYLEEAQVRADLIVAERLREAADLLEHRGGGTASRSCDRCRRIRRWRRRRSSPPSPSASRARGIA